VVRQPRQGEEKKLREAARFWVGADNDDQAQSDAVALGLELPQQAPAEFEVFPENWEAVLMWMRVGTQWRTTMDGISGLDYSVLLGPGKMFDLYAVDNGREMLEDLQVMEATVLELRAGNGA
jgi:hypothetical protein